MKEEWKVIKLPGSLWQKFSNLMPPDMSSPYDFIDHLLDEYKQDLLYPKKKPELVEEIVVKPEPKPEPKLEPTPEPTPAVEEEPKEEELDIIWNALKNLNERVKRLEGKTEPEEKQIKVIKDKKGKWWKRYSWP